MFFINIVWKTIFDSLRKSPTFALAFQQVFLLRLTSVASLHSYREFPNGLQAVRGSVLPQKIGFSVALFEKRPHQFDNFFCSK